MEVPTIPAGDAGLPPDVLASADELLDLLERCGRNQGRATKSEKLGRGYEEVAFGRALVICCHALNSAFRRSPNFVDAETLASCLFAHFGGTLVNAVLDAVAISGDLVGVPCELLANLALDKRACRSVYDAGVFDVICPLLRVANADTCEQIAGAIVTIASNLEQSVPARRMQRYRKVLELVRNDKTNPSVAACIDRVLKMMS